MILVAFVRSAAVSAPGSLIYRFVGSGADRAAILTEGSLPMIGGGWGCGQFNQGSPSCTLRDDQQRCCNSIAPMGFDLSGQTITIYVIETRTSIDFIEWQGVCRPPSLPCVPGPSAPWCQGGLDYRGPREPQTAAHTCTLQLPSDGDVEVVTRWEGEPDDTLSVCGQFQAPAGTCTTTTLGPGGTTTTTLPQFKQKALDHMKLEVQQALYPCVVSGTGIIVFFTGGLAVGPIAGSTMISVAAPVCVKLLKTLIDLQMTYNDPPDPTFHHIAHVAPATKPSLTLPACTGLDGKDRTLCRRLERAATRWVAAVDRVESVAAALATTANRFGAAGAANDRKAVKKQARAARRLTHRLDVTVRARAHAGRKLAGVLRAAGVTGALSDLQSAEAVDVVLTGLSAQGFAEETARALLGSALTPGEVDLLSALGQP